MSLILIVSLIASSIVVFFQFISYVSASLFASKTVSKLPPLNRIKSQTSLVITYWWNICVIVSTFGKYKYSKKYITI